jgi:sulfate transport system ATP-binding protein
VHVRERQVGFVFQHYALFRHMTVFENVAFGLRVKPRGQRPSEAQIKQKVHDLLNLVQLDWLADRFPSQLSGGQRQRIALARALAVSPRCCCWTSRSARSTPRCARNCAAGCAGLHDDLHVTSIFVTHDQEEALEVADRVVLMNAGNIEQVGSPQEVWDHPASPFVYGFLGDVNLFHGRATRARCTVARPAAGVAGALSDAQNAEGLAVTCAARPGTCSATHLAPPASWPSCRAHRVGPTARLELLRWTVSNSADNGAPIPLIEAQVHRAAIQGDGPAGGRDRWC